MARASDATWPRRFATRHYSLLVPASREITHRLTTPQAFMKVTIKNWHAIAQWRWDTGSTEPDDADGEGDVCGICRVPYEGCCPSCKMPGDDCPLSEWQSLFSRSVSLTRALVWGECSHVFHMHCLLKWIGTAASKGQCPMDRRAWGTYYTAQGSSIRLTRAVVTAERKVDKGS